jgi:CO/xanthine dehydrogenase Mo-binding subunit
VEIRKRTAMTKGEKMTCGQELDTALWFPQCIDAVVEGLGPKPEPRRPGNLVGFGLGCNLQPFGRPMFVPDDASAWIGLEMDGSVVVRCGVPDVGAGQVSSLAQIAAEVLHVDVADVTVHFGDSARTPLAGRTTATRQLLMSGNATLKAATALRDQVLEGVTKGTGVGLDQLSYSVGGIMTPNGVVSIVDAVKMCQEAAVPTNALETYFQQGVPVPGKIIKDMRAFPGVTVGAHAAWVEVDPETGYVGVRDYVACHDVGRAINPLSVEGQISGAVAQGLGYALSERIVYEDGQNLTGAFYQYSIPNSADLPDIRTVILESGEGAGPFGARGIGEPPIGPCASTIASAVEDAVGSRPTRLPILSEVVLECIDVAMPAWGESGAGSLASVRQSEGEDEHC